MDHFSLVLFLSALVFSSALLGAVIALASGKFKWGQEDSDKTDSFSNRLVSLEEKLQSSQIRLAEKDAQLELLREKLDEAEDRLSRRLGRMTEMISQETHEEIAPLEPAVSQSSPRPIRSLLLEIEKTQASSAKTKEGS